MNKSNPQSRSKSLIKNGKAVSMNAIDTDISKYKKMQLEYQHLLQIIEQIHDSVISTDLDGFILGWNAGSEMLFGYTADEIIGKHIKTLYLEDDLESLENNIENLIRKGELHTETRYISKSRQLIFAELTLSLLKDEEGNSMEIIAYSKDITKRKKAEEKLRQQKKLLRHQAYHDPLTGLPNRILFNDRLQEGIEKAKCNKTELALFFIDIDRFKQINDSLGHEVGDIVLKEIAERLQANIRKNDILGRLGGDEFTILIEELSHKEDASLLATKILEVFKEPVKVGDHLLYASSSIGISLYPQDGVYANDLLKYADTAMYRAKEEGRNNFQFYSAEMTEQAFEKLVMKSSLRQAIDNNEFVLHYQPQVDAENKTLTGIEALIRWNHPTMGLILPSRFLPLAEETGLIVEIDQWVMKTAMAQVSKWYEEGLRPGVLALNLAVKQLEDKHFIQTVQNSMDTCNFKSEWLELEVTEGQVMQKPEETVAKLIQINDLGIGIAIDDFGTGYSSLSHLKRLPINKLKIDQSFVQDVPTDEEDVAIVRAIIALAKSLNLDLIAEGVETSEQKTFLQKQGCINVQGYYYNRPMPAENMHALLSKKGDMEPA